MSVRVNVRLPDDVHTDCKAYVQAHGIGLTDMIISGLLSQLQPVNTIAKTEIVQPGASGDTVYEPDPKKPINKQVKSFGKQVHPVVSHLLSGISKAPLVSHHPQCQCGVCKVAA